MAITQRKRYLIKKSFQIRYIGTILLFIMLTAAISSILIYLSIYPYLSEKLAGVYPQGRLITVLKSANAKVAISLMVILPIAAWLGVILTHRIAGPWYRLELILRDLAGGNLSTEVRLRKNDELQSLADSINRLILNLRSMSQENRAHIETLKETLRSFESELNSQPFDMIKARLLASKMSDMCKELEASLKKHRLNED